MLALLLAAVLVAEPAGGHDPQQLIAVLKSDAPASEKAVTCKRLAIYGNKDAVPVLAPLLADEKLASWARIALEALPDPAADDALRDALGTLKGKLLIGVINTIGVRRDTKALNVLTAKLKDADAGVASAAAVALGRIGGPVVAATLTPLLGSLRPAAAEGCILCAEQLLADGEHAAAAKLYDAVRAANVSKQKTLEATRGAILARQADGVPLLVEQLRSQDRAFFNIALRTVREMPGSAAGQVLSAELERATPDRQPYLLLALADRGGPEVLPAALKAAQAGSFELRLAAVKVLGKLGDLSCLPVLVTIVAEDDAGLAQAAKSALVRLPGEPVDAAVAGLLNQTSANARRAGIELVAARRVLGALPALLQVAVAPDPALATASLKALGDLGGEAEIPAMIGVLLKTQAPDAAESALASLCARLGRPVTGNVVIQRAVYGELPDGPSADVTAKVAGILKTGALFVEASNRHFGDPAGGRVKKLCVQYTVNGQPVTRTVNENETIKFAINVVPPAVADALCTALPQATGAAKLALLRVLRSAGGPKALAALRAAATDPSTEVKETALRALCDWDTADVLPDMVQLARTTTDKKWKILALRAQLRLIPLQEATTAEKLAALKEAMALIERTEEKRLALAALAEIPSAGSLALVVPFLGTGGLKEEASIAAVAIGEKIVGKNPSEVAGAMKQVSTTNKKLASRVRQLQAQTKGK
jgi:HEAT repeat protein